MPVYGNLGQLGQKGAYEILGAKVSKTKEGLIEVEMPPKKEPEPKEEKETKAEAKVEAKSKEGKEQ